MTSPTIPLALFALAAALSACTDAIPTQPQESAAAAQPQSVDQPAAVDDSLCPLLNPLLRRGISRVSAYGEVSDALEAVNAPCADRTTPLHFAAATSDLQVVELLIERGADIHAVSGAGETPLIYAVGAIGGLDSNAEALRMLLDAGADVNAAREFGQSALHVAALFAKPNAVAALLEYGPIVDPQDFGGRTPLHYAALQSSSAEPARLLVNAGANPDAVANDGVTPLRYAVEHASADTVRVLLEAGAEVDPVDNFGLTPLIAAALEGGAPLIRVLLEHGANINAVDSDGRTALHIAARHNPLSAVAELLLDAGANPRLQDRHGNTVCDLLSRHLSDPDVRRRICEAR